MSTLYEQRGAVSETDRLDSAATEWSDEEQASFDGPNSTDTAGIDGGLYVNQRKYGGKGTHAVFSKGPFAVTLHVFDPTGPVMDTTRAMAIPIPTTPPTEEPDPDRGCTTGSGEAPADPAGPTACSAGPRSAVARRGS